jgi:hypothetical protein
MTDFVIPSEALPSFRAKPFRHSERSRGIPFGTRHTEPRDPSTRLRLAQDDIQGKTEHTIIRQAQDDGYSLSDDGNMTNT